MLEACCGVAATERARHGGVASAGPRQAPAHPRRQPKTSGTANPCSPSLQWFSPVFSMRMSRCASTAPEIARHRAIPSPSGPSRRRAVDPDLTHPAIEHSKPATSYGCQRRPASSPRTGSERHDSPWNPSHSSGSSAERKRVSVPAHSQARRPVRRDRDDVRVMTFPPHRRVGCATIPSSGFDRSKERGTPPSGWRPATPDSSRPDGARTSQSRTRRQDAQEDACCASRSHKSHRRRGTRRRRAPRDRKMPRLARQGPRNS